MTDDHNIKIVGIVLTIINQSYSGFWSNIFIYQYMFDRYSYYQGAIKTIYISYLITV